MNAQAVTKNVKKCSAKETKNINQIGNTVGGALENDDVIDQAAAGSDCVLMRNYKLMSSNYTIIENIEDGQDCIDHCYDNKNCTGFSISTNPIKCHLLHDLGKYVPDPGWFLFDSDFKIL